MHLYGVQKPLIYNQTFLSLSFQSNTETSIAAPLLEKSLKRKTSEVSAGLVQRAATIGSCPVLYGQSVLSASECLPSDSALLLDIFGREF